MARKKSDKQEWMKVPDWLKKVSDKEVASSVFAIMFNWEMSGPDKFDDLREYIKDIFDDLSDKQVDEVADLLIEHKVVE